MAVRTQAHHEHGRQETTRLAIGGMHCASCVAHIEKSLRHTPGVGDVAVNLATEQATISYDPDRVNRNDLEEAVRKAGYEVVATPAHHAHTPPAPAGHEHHHGMAPPGPAGSERAAAELALWRRAALIGLVLAGPVVVLGMAVPGTPSGIIQFALTAALQVVVGREYYRGAWRAARHGRADMDSLVAIGTTAALGYSVYTLALGAAHFYFDTAAVILALIAAGKWMEVRARGEARRALASLAQLRPATALVERDGRELEIPASEVRPGDVVVVRPGARLPADGALLDGRLVVDESMVTGESMPVEKGPGDAVIGGTVNQSSAGRYRAARVGADSLLGQIITLVDRAQSSKARIQRLADRVAGVFVPIVLLIAGATLILWGAAAGDWSGGIRAAIAVLIVACPCALGLATPAAIMVGTGVGARRGILIKDAAVLERAGGLDTAILDKTGTLTVGRPEVTDVVSLDGAPERAALLRLAAAAEAASEHPLARAIVLAAGEGPLPRASAFASTTGAGVSADVEGSRVEVGKPRPGDPADLIGPLQAQGKTVVVVRLDGRAAGLIALADRPKPGAKAAVRALERLGLRVLLMTGDNEATARAVAAEVGIGEVLAGVLPHEKEGRVRALQKEGRRVAMVGDGVNDAPALAAADVGIAVGTGTDIAKEAGDVVLVSGDLAQVPTAVALSRAMMRRIRLGLFWAFAYNLLLVPLGALGYLHPMLAAGAMGLSSVSVVANALTLRWFRGPGPEPPQ